MKTVKEIADLLAAADKPEQWMEALEEDTRKGVQKEWVRWRRNYSKRLEKERQHCEKIAFDSSYKPFPGAKLAGIDEAGRGPLAGPVVCAAVILPEKCMELVGLDDSKKIARQERERLERLIKEIAVSYSVHVQSSSAIDTMNIYAATRDSMEKAVYSLETAPDIVLADAMKLTVGCESVSIVKGDEKSLSIAAASILAKTARDRLMKQWDEQYPVYNFKQNAGYGTEEHLKALELYGPCEIHRLSFSPVRAAAERRAEQYGQSPDQPLEFAGGRPGRI